MIKLLLTILLFGCSTSKPKNPGKVRENIDKRLIPYVEAFEEEYGKEIPEYLIVDFRNIPDPKIAGVCNYVYDFVFIDEPKWLMADETVREIIMFHELGHCVLKRDHVWHEDEKRCPPSIMKYKVIDPGCYEKYRDHYIKELFGRE